MSNKIWDILPNQEVGIDELAEGLLGEQQKLVESTLTYPDCPLMLVPRNTEQIQLARRALAEWIKQIMHEKGKI